MRQTPRTGLVAHHSQQWLDNSITNRSCGGVDRGGSVAAWFSAATSEVGKDGTIDAIVQDARSRVAVGDTRVMHDDEE
jgi:hypothetical protein